jgi:hypothetical protein
MPHASVLPARQREFFYDEVAGTFESIQISDSSSNSSSDENGETNDVGGLDPVLEEDAYAQLMNEYFGPPIGAGDDANVTSPGPQPEAPRQHGDPVDNHWARVDAQARVPLFEGSTTSK